MEKQTSLNKITQLISIYQLLLDKNNDNEHIFVNALNEASIILEHVMLNDIINTIRILKNDRDITAKTPM